MTQGEPPLLQVSSTCSIVPPTSFTKHEFKDKLIKKIQKMAIEHQTLSTSVLFVSPGTGCCSCLESSDSLTSLSVCVYWALHLPSSPFPPSGTNSQSSFKTHDGITSPVKSFLPALPYLVFTHVTSGTLLIQYSQTFFTFIYASLSFP